MAKTKKCLLESCSSKFVPISWHQHVSHVLFSVSDFFFFWSSCSFKMVDVLTRFKEKKKQEKKVQQAKSSCAWALRELGFIV